MVAAGSPYFFLLCNITIMSKKTFSFKNMGFNKADIKSILIRKAFAVITGIAIIIIGHIIAKTAENAIKHSNHDQNDSEKKRRLVIDVMATIIYWVILAIAFILVLRVFGLEIASIIAMISAIGLAIGLSLQGVLSDIASGILLAFFQTYNVGDIIRVDDVEGTVLEFKLIYTVLLDLQTKTIVTVPNRKIQDNTVVNISKQPHHYFAFDMLLSNTNKNFQDIVDLIKKDLHDQHKYPDILRNVPFYVGVYDFAEVGTKVRVRVPLNPQNLELKRTNIRTMIRQTLAFYNITLVDPF